MNSPASHGRSSLRRLVWAMVILDLAGIAFGLLLEYGAGASSRFATNFGVGGPDYLFGIAQLGSLGFGALIALRLPRHPVGWLLITSATAFILDLPVTYYIVYAIHVSGREIAVADFLGTIESVFWVPGVVPVAVFLPLLFPTGRLLSRRWLPITWLAVAGSVAGILGGFLGSHQDQSSFIVGVRPLTGPPQLFLVGDALTLGFILLPVAVIAAVVSLGLRYRREGVVERHQIKWLLFAISLYGFGFLASVLSNQLFHYQFTWLQTVATVGLILIPVSAAVAVLKYRLYDIDIVISRTLVYGALAVFITVVYVSIVVGVGTLIGSHGRPNLALSIVATAVVAVAFQPVRERLQKSANRIVYGERATPYEILSEFSARVAESYAAIDVLSHMARVLAEGTDAARAEVWLCTGPVMRQAGCWPAGAEEREPAQVSNDALPGLLDADRAVEVRHRGELLGALTISKRTGESVTPIEERLLEDLAHQAGLVLKNVGLTGELRQRLEDLRASRQRLVAAQDEERRRLERNLHDGAQQNLVALKIKLGLAEMTMAKDPQKAELLLGELKSETVEALDTLRDLARGIYPPLLAEQGLVAALVAQAHKATVKVAVEADGVRRYPQEVEAAIYFCVLEALQNVQKHAGAAGVQVGLRDDGQALLFVVEDDGAGFDAALLNRGAGLQNMDDRLDALGGSVDIYSSPGSGTTISGSIPVAAVARVV